MPIPFGILWWNIALHLWPEYGVTSLDGERRYNQSEDEEQNLLV